MFLPDVLAYLKRYLSTSRYEHSLRVGETARHFAHSYSLSLESAYLAGILHDIAKPASPDNTYGEDITFTDFEIQLYQEYPKVWHAFVGPKYVAAGCGFISFEVADAIMYHTTGKADMLPLTEVVYVSDFVEPGRTTSASVYINSLAKYDLDSAIYAITVLNINQLKMRGSSIYPETLKCFNFYKERVKDDARKSILISLEISADEFG